MGDLIKNFTTLMSGYVNSNFILKHITNLSLNGTQVTGKLLTFKLSRLLTLCNWIHVNSNFFKSKSFD